MRKPAHLTQESAVTLVEVMLAIAMVAFSFSSIFLLYSQGMRMVRTQHEQLAANLCVQQRAEQLRSGSWADLTSASRLQQTVLSESPVSSTPLRGLQEEISVSAYPPSSGNPPKTTVRRDATGGAVIISDAAAGELSEARMARVDLRISWQRQQGTMNRETSMVVAVGGILR